MREFTLGTMYWENPKLGPAEIDADMARIRENEIELVRTFVWWEKTEPRPGRYDFDHHDLLHEAAARHGLKIMETFGLYLPQWLKERNAAKGIDDSNRRYACFDRPEVREPMQGFIEATVKRYRSSPALAMWNLQNEPGKPPCRCEHTLARFVEFLRARYPDLEALRGAWMGEHGVFGTAMPESMEALDVDFVQRAFRFASRGRATPMRWDFFDFASQNLNDNLGWIGSVVRALDPEREQHANPCSPFTNASCLGRDGESMAEVLDSISISVHPSHNFNRVEPPGNFSDALSHCVEMVRDWSGGKEAWVGEYQAGTTILHNHTRTPDVGDLDRAIFRSFGRGLRGLVFWLWQSWRAGVFEAGEFGLRRPADGGPTERSEAVRRAGAILRRHRDEFAALTPAPARAAIVVSRAANILKHIQSEARPDRDIANFVEDAVHGCFRALNAANIPVDLISDDRVARGGLRGYRVVFVPQAEVVEAATASALANYVREGGRLWADGHCAFQDRYMFVRDTIPGHGLDAVFGCRESDFLAARPGDAFRFDDGTTLPAHRFAQLLEPRDGGVARARRVVGDNGGYGDGAPMVVRRSFGEGYAELCGTSLCQGLVDEPNAGAMEYLAAFAREAGAASDPALPPGWEGCRLEGPELDVYVITNRTGAEATLSFRLEGEFKSVECPQDADGRATTFKAPTVRRAFGRFETALFIARR